MKNTLIFVWFAFVSLFIQAQNPPPTPKVDENKISSNVGALSPLKPQQFAAAKEVNELNAVVVKFYAEKKYDEALPIAEKAAQIADANALFDAGRSVAALTNLAEIYLVKKREKDAAELFERAIVAYGKTSNSSAQAQTLERLAGLQSVEISTGKAEKNYLEALKLRESIKGGQTTEVVTTLLKIATFYNYIGKPEKAEIFYQRAVGLSDKVHKPDDPEYNTAFSRYQCWAYQNKGLKDGTEYIAKYVKQRKRDYADPLKQNPILQGGVVNGKAKRLITPIYPPEAKAVRAGGVVLVQVLIDETGKVIEAKTTCGYDVFARECEGAALKSSFTPTSLNGRPVKVNGIIVYNFGYCK